MGGEMHYLTVLRISFPEYASALESVAEFSQLPADIRKTILQHWHKVLDESLPPVTEDSMPGELANIISGRVANVFNFRGPNFITDAACASSLAAVEASIELLVNRQVDSANRGVDHNMEASSFIKPARSAPSATGTPVRKKGAGFVKAKELRLLLKRLEDAEATETASTPSSVGSAGEQQEQEHYALTRSANDAIRRAWQTQVDPRRRR
jgi:acyl transferase domain-containing protein